MEDFIESIVLAVEPNKEQAGYKLFYTHLAGMVSLPLVFLAITVLRIPIFICYVPLYIYHLVKKRCPVTRVERKLHLNDTTVIDVFLVAIGAETTRDNRNMMLMFLSTAFMIYMISIMSTW